MPELIPVTRVTRVAVVVSHPIQHFCPQYESWSGVEGAEIKVFFASAHGVQPYRDKNFSRTVRWSNLRLNFPHEFLPDSADKPLGADIDCAQLSGKLSDFDPEVLIVYGYSQKLQRRALAWAKSRHVCVVMIADSELRSRRSKFKLWLKGCFLPYYLRKIDFFFTVGDANEAYYRHYGVADSKFIRSYFPIDSSHYDRVLEARKEARARVRLKLCIPETHKVVLNVGKLVPWKRQEDLVQLSSRLQGKRSDVTVILAGSGPDAECLQAGATLIGPGGVIFAGFVAPEELAEYYCAADVYAHCSEHEPHSLAISEAVYCGLPIVVSNRCGSFGPSDDVQSGVNGFVFRCGEVADLEENLVRILADQQLCQRMGAASGVLGQRHQALAHGGALRQLLHHFGNC